MGAFIAIGAGFIALVAAIFAYAFCRIAGLSDRRDAQLLEQHNRREPGRTRPCTPAGGAPDPLPAGDTSDEFHIATRSFHAGEVTQP